MPGDEVITVGHTFNATVSAILYTGATPVFVDIEPDTYVIDAARIEAAITPRTRAICPVHLFGLPADMDMILAIADRHGLAVVEDACQAHGAEFRGRRVGSFGHGAFSLYGTKNMTTGEGGLITTDDDRLADWIRLYRNQGMRERYHHEILGYNFRLTDIAAAIGLCQLDKLERNTARRRAIAARYDAAFADLPVRTPIIPAGRTHVFHQYTIDVGADRDGIVAVPRRGRGLDRDLLPDPGQSPAVRAGARHQRGPADDGCRVGAHAVAADVPGALTDAEQDEVIAAVRAERRGRRRNARGSRRPMTGDWSPAGDRALRVGLIGLGSMGRNHLRVLGLADRATLAAIADPDPGRHSPRRPPRPAPRGSPNRSRCSPRRTSTRSSSPRRRRPTCRSPSPPSSAGSPSSSRSPWPRRPPRRT